MKTNDQKSSAQLKQSSSFFGKQGGDNAFFGNKQSTQFFRAKPAQMKGGGDAQQNEGKSGSSQKLPGEFRSKMENSFQSDFSNVNVYANSEKASGAGALAYAQGNDIHFSPGQFNTSSKSGQELVAHELSHVNQQREGRVKPTTEVNGMAVNDSAALENEADKDAVTAVKGETVQKKGAGGSGSNAAQHKRAPIQRKTGLTGSVGAGGTNRKSDVRAVQQMLNSKGHNLSVDGLIGPKTIAAIKSFQSSKFGWADGRVDPGGKTWGKLSQGSSTSGGGSAGSISGSVGSGGKNSKTDVRTVQQMLNSNGYSLSVDGAIGPKTIGAIKDFQSTRFGWSDGRVDPGGKTWGGLVSKKPANQQTDNGGGSGSGSGSTPTNENQGGGSGNAGGQQQEGSYNIIYASKVSSEFARKTIEISQYLGVNPNYLMAAMAFETGGSFSPSVKNAAGSGATGLIQFMPSTARGLGTSTSALAQMSAVQQLDWVKKYFEPYKGRLSSLSDVYMAILWPAAVGKSEDYVLFRSGTIAYTQNRGLDTNKNGLITKKEAAGKVYGRLEIGQKDMGQVETGQGGQQEQTNQGGGNSGNGGAGGGISGAVGAGAGNSPSDVAVVKQLLNNNGYDLTVGNANVGPKTISAIMDFQRTRFGWRNPDGVIDPGGTTWNGLKNNAPVKYEANVAQGDPNAPTDKPNWLSIAEGELGVKENTSKSRHNPRVVEYHSTTGGWKEDETPWCASFVNWVMKRSGHGGNGSAWAQSWATYGKKVDRPCYGAIVVFKWSSRTGHVGFVVGKSGSKIRVLGGNQSNEVNISNYSTSKVLAYVVPSSFNVPSSFFNLAEGQGVDGSVSGTR